MSPRLSLAILVAAWTLGLAEIAPAYHVSCADLAGLAENSSTQCTDRDGNGVTAAFESGTGAGAVLGIVDTIAALVCLGGPALADECRCAQNIVFDQPQVFAERLAVVVSDCLARNPNGSVVGQVLATAQGLCGF